MTRDELIAWYNYAILKYLENNNAITNYRDDMNFNANLDSDTDTFSYTNWTASCDPPTYSDLIQISMQDVDHMKDLYNATSLLSSNDPAVAENRYLNILTQFANNGSICYDTTNHKLVVYDDGQWNDVLPCTDDPITVASLICNGTLQVSDSSTLGGGLQFGNPDAVMTGLGTSVNYYKQGIVFSATMEGGGESTTTICKCTRFGSIVYLNIQPFTLTTTTSEPFNITASSIFNGNVPSSWSPSITVSSTARVTCGSSVAIGLCEIDSSGNITIYGSGNLTPSLTGTVTCQSFSLNWDLS